MTCPSSVIYNGSAQEPCSATVTGAGGFKPIADGFVYREHQCRYRNRVRIVSRRCESQRTALPPRPSRSAKHRRHTTVTCPTNADLHGDAQRGEGGRGGARRRRQGGVGGGGGGGGGRAGGGGGGGGWAHPTLHRCGRGCGRPEPLSPAPSYTNNVNAGTATASYDFAGDGITTVSSDTDLCYREKRRPRRRSPVPPA